MSDLDYGYEVTIAQNATSDPAASSVTNQWQRQISGNTNWENIAGATGETYTIDEDDRSAKIRLQQDLDGAKVYSNELKATDDKFPSDNFGDFPATAQKWDGGVLAPNGKIYCIPCNSNQVLVIDPENKTTSTFGSLGTATSKWRGGVLAPNGKVYGMPMTSTKVIEIDPSNDSVNTFSSVENGFYGGVVAHNGKIYGIPYGSDKVLEIDPVAKTTTTFGSSLGGTKQRWLGGVLHPNGKIYGIPHNRGSILEIDPDGKTATVWGDFGTSSYKWAGAVLGPTGKIYGIPHNMAYVLEIDTENRTTRALSSSRFSGQAKYKAGVMAPNGIIYGSQCRMVDVLEIDPIAETVERDSGAAMWDTPTGQRVLAVDGKIYGVPYDGTEVVVVDLGLPPASGNKGEEVWPLDGLPGDVLDPRSPYFNHL